MELATLNHYLRIRTRMGGWFSAGAARLFAFIEALQKEEGIQGDLFEIGVHQGRSAVLLALMADPQKECTGLCDVFDSQDSDGNGVGERRKGLCLQNLEAYAKHRGTVRVYEKLSSQLTLAETGARCRFFHIDGGHSADETYGDLQLAERAILPQGIIAVDDYFNSVWPGVSEGICRFLFQAPGALTPLAIGFNKVFFCRPAHHAWYLERLRADESKTYLSPPPDTKLKPFFQSDTLIYLPVQPRSVLERVRTRLRHQVKNGDVSIFSRSQQDKQQRRPPTLKRWTWPR